MKLRCPACGTGFKLSEAAQAADLQELDKLAAGFGGDWPLIREYLGCFKGKREMKADKVLRLTQEVQEMWHTGKICLGGCWYQVGREEFREALRLTCNQVTPPLTNHNYLRKVLMAAAEKTSKRLERELREKEEGLRSAGQRPAPLDALPARGEGGEDDPEWRREHLRLLKELRLAQRLGPEQKARAEAALREHEIGRVKACGHG